MLIAGCDPGLSGAIALYDTESGAVSAFDMPTHALTRGGKNKHEIEELGRRHRKVRVEHGDCREIVPQLGTLADAIVTDPPYHLTSTVSRFGKIDLAADTATSARLRARGDGSARLARGFMNLSWDGGDVAFRPETWAAIGTALRPGGFLLAFGGTRTYHRLVCAIEDGGFIVQDCVSWVYGSGFPKRRDMLKPAVELICLAYKPGGKRTLQVDECRVHCDDARGGDYLSARLKPGALLVETGGNWHRDDEVYAGWTPPGRWPANVIHDGSDEVLTLFPQSAGQQGDVRGTEPSDRLGSNGIYGHASARRPAHPKRDGEASASRRYSANGSSNFAALPGARREETSAARFFYCAKADSEDRWGSRHPTVKPLALIRYLVKLVCPLGGLVLDPFAGSGTTGVAAMAEGRRAILIEREEGYIADIRERLAHYEGEGRHSLVSKNRNAGDRDKPGALL